MSWLAFMPTLFHAGAAACCLYLAWVYRLDRNLVFIAMSLFGLSVAYGYARAANVVDLFYYGATFDPHRVVPATLGAFCTLCVALGLHWRVVYGYRAQRRH